MAAGLPRRPCAEPRRSLAPWEWTICDDGWSQNGTWVNGLRLAARRRPADGDLVTIGRTAIAYCNPRPLGAGATMNDMPRADRRAEIALLAVRSGLVG